MSSSLPNGLLVGKKTREEGTTTSDQPCPQWAHLKAHSAFSEPAQAQAARDRAQYLRATSQGNDIVGWVPELF